MTALFAELSSLDTLTESMEEAVIVLIPKSGKDTQDYASYRTISLIKCRCKNSSEGLGRPAAYHY